MLEKLCRASAVGLTAGLLVLASCVSGDSAPVGGTALPDGGSTPDTGTGSDASTADAGKCPANTAECDGDPDTMCETDLRTSGDHCGACGRSCGGALCQGGQCAAQQLVTGLPTPFSLRVSGGRLVWHQGDVIMGCRIADCNASKAPLVDVETLPANPDALSPRQIAVDDKNFYYARCTAGSCGVARCDLGGCKLTGSTMISQNFSRRSQLVQLANGGVYTYHGLEGLSRVDLTTNGVTYGPYALNDQLQAVYADPATFAWVDPDASAANPVGGLFACPYSGCSLAARVRLLPPPVRHLAIANKIAFTSSAGAALSSSTITGCALAGCGQAGNVLATNQAYVSDIEADETAVYWSTTGVATPASNNAAVGTVMRCALPACAGGPAKVADTLVNPTSIALDKDYIYWLTRGGTAANTGEIWRRRR
jgi:hypothetical protein